MQKFSTASSVGTQTFQTSGTTRRGRSLRHPQRCASRWHQQLTLTSRTSTSNTRRPDESDINPPTEPTLCSSTEENSEREIKINSKKTESDWKVKKVWEKEGVTERMGGGVRKTSSPWRVHYVKRGSFRDKDETLWIRGRRRRKGGGGAIKRSSVMI